MNNRRNNLSFYVGDEYRTYNDRFNWVKETFSDDAYTLVDDGWLVAEYFIVFKNEGDALLYKLRWC